MTADQSQTKTQRASRVWRRLARPTSGARQAGLRALTTLSLLTGAVAPILQPGVSPAYAASINGASFTGGDGTSVAGGTLYARSGQSVTLKVDTGAARCVMVSGDHSDTKTSKNDRTAWTFGFAAGSGDGQRRVQARAYSDDACSLSQSTPVSASYVVDNTAPVPSAYVSPAPNGAGWNNSDVALAWSATDSGSGVKSVSPSSDSVTADTSAAGVTKTTTATDNVGNSTTGTSRLIKLDKTKPTLSGAPTAAPNGDSGWYRGDVIIKWTASDALSGIDESTRPADATITGEGQNLTRSAAVRDVAGNEQMATSSPAVKIDRTAPVTLASASDAWSKQDVTVQLTPSDLLSGVKATYFKVNGGAQQTGTSVPTSVPFSAEGTHTLEFWSVDLAGNVEASKSVQVKIDKTAPAISTSQSPAAVDGWNNTSVTTTFTCSDSLSGCKTSLSSQTISTEGAQQKVSGTAEDNAGNSSTADVFVSIDRSAPSISAVADRTANASGWYRADVTVSFTCSDSLSGIKSCPTAQTLSEEKAGQSASGTATDAAGNSKSDSLSGISIDKTAPTLSGTPSGAQTGGWYTGDVTVVWSCGDLLSGIDGACPGDTVIKSEGNNLSAIATVKDKAGNATTKTVDGIKIDRSAPSTTATIPAALDSGWYLPGVEITLAAEDAPTGAGVDKISYSVNGAPAQLYAAPIALTKGGDNTVEFWSVDKAGNAEAKKSLSLKIDNVAPRISQVSRTPANAHGWNAGDVTLTFTCADDESGIATCSESLTAAAEGAGKDGEGQALTGDATDKAGNSANLTIGQIKIDRTKPTITGRATTEPNALGWYRGDVVIEWTATDGLSGIDPDTKPANSTVHGEGDALSASKAVADKAGNRAESSVDGIKIDRTKPTIEGKATTEPNAEGWYRGPVTVKFDCTDALSGVATCADAAVLSADGTGLAASGKALDKAGNENSATAGGINIDTKAPNTEAEILCTRLNGWCSGATATVVLTAADERSGVKSLSFRLGKDGELQTVAGSSARVQVPLFGAGDASVYFFAEDLAGNVEAEDGVSLQFDTVAPKVTALLSPEANAAGWSKSDVTVSFKAEDNKGGAGVDVASVTAAETISSETASLWVSGSATDFAGNTGEAKVEIKLDKTAPSITASVAKPNDNGWYKDSVNVVFDCADSGSGIADAACPKPYLFGENGAGQSVTRTVADVAGNESSVTVSGINIDTAAPKLEVTGVVEGRSYVLGTANPGCAASDDLSGLTAACTGKVEGGLANGVGTFTYTASATDKAGNTTTKSVTYSVIYRYDGVSSPLSDPIAQGGQAATLNTSSTTTGTSGSVSTAANSFRAGSTIPVKFQPKRSDGTPLRANSDPDFLVNGVKVGTFRWDDAAKQYIFNWNTDRGQTGSFRLSVRLDDGSKEYPVSVTLTPPSR